MKVLLCGGAGHVGSFITPYLKEQHALRVLDMRPPRYADLEYVEGSVTDPQALKQALEGVDAFIWLVMRKPQGGSFRDQDVETIAENYDVNCKGLHLCLFTAQELGVMRGEHFETLRHRALDLGAVLVVENHGHRKLAEGVAFDLQLLQAQPEIRYQSDRAVVNQQVLRRGLAVGRGRC